MYRFTVAVEVLYMLIEYLGKGRLVMGLYPYFYGRFVSACALNREECPGIGKNIPIGLILT
jgi:hypothetical protein